MLNEKSKPQNSMNSESQKAVGLNGFVVWCSP